MAQDFYPFVENVSEAAGGAMQVRHPARIAVYDDAAAAPRVVVVEPKDVREYLEEITLQVTQLSSAQGGTIPFMVIREIVENFIHAYFMEPTISILDKGNTIRFSDQGPGIAEKSRALQYGTSSATEEMRRYIRGVGSGLPYVQQYMQDKGGSLRIDDNMAGGTVVTISIVPAAPPQQYGPQAGPLQQGGWPQQQTQQAPWPAQQMAQQQMPQEPWAAQQQMPQEPWAAQQMAWSQQTPQQPQSPWPTHQPQQPAYAQPSYPQQGWPTPMQQSWQNPWQSPQYAPSAVPPAEQAQAGPSAPSWLEVTVRGRAILDYLATHDSVGPSDLARTYGESQPTWTRELQTLEEAGLIRKDGQKRRLTAMGKRFISGT